jgi:hypothetical protein
MADRVAPYGLAGLVTGQQSADAGPDIAKVKRNIQRMIDQNAPETDIDAYVASEGVTIEQLQGRQATTPQFREGDASTMFLQGASLGLGDEIVAGGVAGLRSLYDPRTGEVMGGNIGQKYDEALDYERKFIEDTRADHPMGSTALEAAGGLSTAILPMGAAVRGGGMMARGGKAAAVGGGIGAAQGFASGEGGFEQRAGNAVPSAAVGAGLGFASPFLGRAIGAGWNGVANWLSARGVSSPVAVRKILETLQRSGMSPQQAQQRLDELGPEGMIGDVNPGMQAAVGGTAVRDTGAANIISSRLSNRMGRAPQRVEQTLDATLGPPRDPYTQMQGNRAQRGAVGPQYEQALTNAPQLPAHLGTTLQAQLTNPASALGKRQFMLGIMNQVDDALMADTPELAARRLFDLRKNLDAQIVYDPRARFTLSSADKANQEALIEARGAIDDVLKNRIPGFQQADESFAPVAQQQAAYERGRTVLSNKVSEAEHAADIARYSPAERDMSRAGMRYDINQRLEGQRANPNPGNTADRLLIRGGGNARKVEATIGRNRSEALRRGIGREETFTQTSNLGDVRRNSGTAPRMEASEQMWGSGRGILGDVAASAVGGYAGGGLLGATGAAIGTIGRNLGGRAGNAVSGRMATTIRETAERLTATGPQRRLLMQELNILVARLPRNAQTAANVTRIASSILGAGGGLLGQPIAQRAGLLSP